MQTIYHRDIPRLAAREGAEVARFATQIMSLVAASRVQGADDRLTVSLLDGLIAAVLDGRESQIGAMLATFRRGRITDRQLVDDYIPAAARKLGAAWLDDGLSFSQVTVGSARLQALLHSVGKGVLADQAPALPGASVGRTVLFMVPGVEQHTLGALVATNQLRRSGVSVCLRFVGSSAELPHLMAARSFDAAMVSIACREHLAAARNLIQSLRAVSRMPVVIGGAVGLSAEQVLSGSGADLVNHDPVAALQAVCPARSAECAQGRA